MQLAPDIASLAALGVSIVALIFSWRAHELSKSTRRQDLRIASRKELDDAVATIEGLPDAILHLKHQTVFHLARAGMTQSSVAERHEDARGKLEAEAVRLKAAVNDLDADLSKKSDKQLENVLLDAQRLLRDARSVQEKITDTLQKFEKIK